MSSNCIIVVHGIGNGVGYGKGDGVITCNLKEKI